MSDAKVGTNNTSFSGLYQAIENARGEGRVKGGKVLYLKNTTNETATVSATKFWAGQAGREASALIFEAIQTEYGGSVAKRVFKHVLGRDDANHAKVSLDQLRALRKVLRYERKLPSHRDTGIAPATFSAIRRNMAKLKKEREEDGSGDFEPGKHLRFTAKKGLYIHTSWSTGFKDRFGLQTSRQIKRLAAGQKIWRSIANEYDGDVATGIFTDVFGFHAFENKGPEQGMDLTIKNFEDIEQTVKTFERAKEFLDDMSLTPAASPLDVAVALFGPRGGGATRAALKRLEKVLPKEVFQTLRERPSALREYMSHKDRVFSLLVRSSDNKTAEDAWRLVFGDRRVRRILQSSDILKLCSAAQLLKARTFLET